MSSDWSRLMLLIAFLMLMEACAWTDPCVPARYARNLPQAAGIWNAKSEYGGIYTVQIQTEPEVKVIIKAVKPADDDWVVVDQAPSANDIALGSLTGQPVAAWTEFAKDQEHPKTATLSCDEALVSRTYYSVPPPATGGGALYMRQMDVRFNFATDPPSMIGVTDFWPVSHPSVVLRYTLVHASSFFPAGAGGTPGNCTSLWECMQTPALGGMIAATGVMLGFFSLVFGSQMDDLVGQALKDAFRPLTDAQKTLADQIRSMDPETLETVTLQLAKVGTTLADAEPVELALEGLELVQTALPSDPGLPEQTIRVDPVPNTVPGIAQEFVDSWNPETGLGQNSGLGDDGGSSE